MSGKTRLQVSELWNFACLALASAIDVYGLFSSRNSLNRYSRRNSGNDKNDKPELDVILQMLKEYSVMLQSSCERYEALRNRRAVISWLSYSASLSRTAAREKEISDLSPKSGSEKSRSIPEKSFYS